MNCLNKSSVGAGVGAVIGGAIGASAGISGVGVAPGLTDGGAEVFISGEVELLEREDLLEPLVDLIGPAAATFLAML